MVIIMAGQLHDKIMNADHFGSPHHLLIFYGSIAKGNIILYRAAEQEYILQYHGDLCTQFVQVKILNTGIINFDRSFIYGLQPVE